MPCGIVYSHNEGDTVISGVTCRKVVRNVHIDSACSGPGFYLSDFPALFFYNTEDTVFVYNRSLNQFTPIYVFNVADGDTVTLTIPPTESFYLTYTATSNTFTFIVDSVRIVQYDTAHLKTVFTRSLDYSMVL